MGATDRASLYAALKHWGPNPRSYCFSSGENGRLGQHVPERYLDDRKMLKATQIKLLCRMNYLPVMDRAGREATPTWPKEHRVCLGCNEGKVEDVVHFVITCNLYKEKRVKLFNRIMSILDNSNGNINGTDFINMPDYDKTLILLGRRINDPHAEDKIDQSVKRYLAKCWNVRKHINNGINNGMDKNYSINYGIAA